VINWSEILEMSRELGLAPQVVEKDYILGWVLAGISNHPRLSPVWIFKGGTCLKKCFFETYRFSEDLDFTLRDESQFNQEFLTAMFAEISVWIYDVAGIEILTDRLRFDVIKNPRGKTSVEGRLYYRGPSRTHRDLPRIKIDLTADEVLVLEPVIRPVHHPYSDQPKEGIFIQCYSFEELFSEKVRALMERQRPRDLYDVIHLYRNAAFQDRRPVILDALTKKCSFRGLPLPTYEDLQRRPERVELEQEWANMLGHQLPALPPFRQFLSELLDFFTWLNGAKARAALPTIQVSAVPALDETWRPPAMVQAWHQPGTSLEVIRFAAANHLCVRLAYQRSHRLIEPYSLRRTQAGHLLLFAVKHETSESRSYRVDRIEGAEATNTPFVPRFAIELTPVTPVMAPRNLGKTR
jgi:predicted nucleotidyltransferase component of viral defense system